MLTLARAVSERGELALLRRSDGALELRVNGVFAMDSSETSSERMLATAALDAVAPRDASPEPEPTGVTVLVGGLGLGFTLAALLDDPRTAEVVVAEIEADLVRWHRSGVVPRPDARGSYRCIVDEPNVTVVVGDVRDHVSSLPDDSVDLVLLDVDNGPGFLLYEANADLYAAAFLRMCARVVRAGGATAVWSASESPDLATAMAEVFETTDRRDVAVRLNARRMAYHLYIGTVAAG